MGFPVMANRQLPPRLPLRWIVILLASLLLHALILEWAGGALRLPSPARPDPAPIIATLKLTPPPAAPPAPAPVAPPVAKAAPVAKAPPKAKTKAKAKPAPRPRPQPAAPRAVPAPPTALTPTMIPAQQAALAQAEEPSSDRLDAPVPAAPDAAPGDAGATNAADAANPDPGPEPAQPPARHFPAYRAALPGSVELKYHVEALRDEKIIYGSGKLSWQYDGESYAAEGQASILFFTLLHFKSSGSIDEFGIAPVIYSEKRFRKAQTNTHFNRVANNISFSASTASYPRMGGEQDRASIVWQLTSIGRADGDRFAPGMALDFFVAGVRDGEPWRFEVAGLEQTSVDGEQVEAWHLARTPRPGSYEQALDIWLDPAREWYPVKLRYTEANGEYLEMSLTRAAPASGP